MTSKTNSSFIAIDVETANEYRSSICQIGIARYEDGELVGEISQYVNPQAYFSDFNIGIHGITPEMVQDAPTFSEIAESLFAVMEGSIVVHHSAFDPSAINLAAAEWGLDEPQCIWLDTLKVARRTWSTAPAHGQGPRYGLRNLCDMIGYEFDHHDALEDAKASARILLEAQRISDLSVEGWVTRSRQKNPNRDSAPANIRKYATPGRALSDEVIVFTGELTIPRREAADMSAGVGAAVGNNVTRKTTMVVVGYHNVDRLAGYTKSRKQRKAEELIAKGQDIRILSEADFVRMTREPRFLKAA